MTNMFKRVKKIYKRHHKKGLKEAPDDKHDHDTKAINNNNNSYCNTNYNDVVENLEQNEPSKPVCHVEEIAPLTETRTTSTSQLPPTMVPSYSVSEICDKNNTNVEIPLKHKRISLLKKHFLKNTKGGRKRDVRRSSEPVTRIHSLSKSTGDLTNRRYSSASVHSPKEERLSVISQLDKYIEHLRRSIDEGNISSAPSRLCCAQLLRTVYLRREQQCQHQSLRNLTHKHNSHSHPHHRNKNLSNRGHSAIPCPTTTTYVPEFRHSTAFLSNASSSHEFDTNSFDSSYSSQQSPQSKVRWRLDSHENSDCSSLNSDEFNSANGTNVNRLAYRECNENKIKKNIMYIRHKHRYDSGFSLNEKGEDDDCDDDFLNNDVDDFSDTCESNPNVAVNVKLSKWGHRKSMPLFPQALDIDIY